MKVQSNSMMHQKLSMNKQVTSLQPISEEPYEGNGAMSMPDKDYR